MLNGLWTGGALDCPTRDLQSSISGIVALVLHLDLDHEPDHARRAFGYKQALLVARPLKEIFGQRVRAALTASWAARRTNA
jgi:hypothetical protein